MLEMSILLPRRCGPGSGCRPPRRWYRFGRPVLIPCRTGGGDGSGSGGCGTGMAARASAAEEDGLPQQQLLAAQQGEGFGAVDSLEGEKLHSRGFDQASAV